MTSPELPHTKTEQLQPLNDSQMVENSVSDDRTPQQYEEERVELRKQLATANAKYDNLEEEFGKMEEEVMERTTKLERIHGTVSELEKRNKALIKRQAVQEEAFELERRERVDTERTLRIRVDDLETQLKKYLASQAEAEFALQNTASDDDTSTTLDQQNVTEAHLISQAKIVAQLRSRIADMSESQLSLTEKHTSLALQIHKLEHEVAERTAECYRLREENEGFEILLRERTLDGRVYDADIFGEMTDDETSGSTVRSDADSQTGSEFNKDTHTVRTKPGTKSQEQPPSSRRRQALNLAEELDNSRASINIDTSDGGEDIDDNAKEEQAAQTKDIPDSTLEGLKAEVKALSDANKALRLYCSKILDRILLHENEDHFLVDVSGSLNRKTHSRTALQKLGQEGGTRNRQLSAHDRPALRPQTFQASNDDDQRDYSNDKDISGVQPLNPQARRSVSQTSVTPNDDSKRSLPSIQVETVTAVVAPIAVKGRLRPLSIVAKKEEREKEAKRAESASEKRLRRGFSLDWRSFSGTRSASPEQAPNSDNRSISPHAPREEATVPYPLSRPAIANSRSYDKKLEIIEDDEEDRIERERLSTTLKLMGVTSPSGVSASSLTVAEDVANTRQNNNISPKPSPNAFSRLSAFFGRSSNDASPSPTNENTKWNYNPHETNPDGQTGSWNGSPLQSKANLTDTHVGFADFMPESMMASRDKRALSDSQVANMSTVGGTTSHRRTAGGDESLSTLWSLGSEVSDA